MSDKAPRETIFLRAPAELKQRLEVYAGRAGVPVNAAAVLLLADALRLAERKAAR